MGAPMPESIRNVLRTRQHPARSVPCKHCGALEFRPCRSQSRTRILTQPHPSRIAAWARTVACCPACQVTPGVECHTNGRPLHDGAVHDERQTEAEGTAA